MRFINPKDELETLAEKWIYFIKSAQSLTEIPDNLEEVPELHQAFDLVNRGELTPEELEAIERRESYIYNQQSAIWLGRKEGLREVARNLRDRRDDNAIAQITGLSLEEVRALRLGNSLKIFTPG